MPANLEIKEEHLKKVNQYIQLCSSKNAFEYSGFCRDFCDLSFTQFVDKTHSLHIYEEIMPYLTQALLHVFPIVLPEYLSLDLESTVLTKIKKDIILDDKQNLYNMKSDHWIKQNSLEKVDPLLPFKSSKFGNDEYFLVKFNRNEDSKNIDVIEDNKNIRMSDERMEEGKTETQEEKREERGLREKIKENMVAFLQQVNGDVQSDFDDSPETNAQNSFPVTKKGIQMNMSLEVQDFFDYNDFKIEPNFKIKMDLNSGAYKKFQEIYEEDANAFRIDFWGKEEGGLEIELLEKHNKGKVLIMINNQPNTLYLERIDILVFRVMLGLMILFGFK